MFSLRHFSAAEPSYEMTERKVSSRTCSPHEMTLVAMQRRTMCVRSEWQHAAVNVVGQPNIWCAFCV